MPKLSNRLISALLVIVVVGATTAAWFERPSRASGAPATSAPVKRGTFKVTVRTTGELLARKSIPVRGPNSQDAQVWQTKVSWIVPEGTVVNTGDSVATLDRGPAATRLTAVQLDAQKAQGQLDNAVLDSALALAAAREDVRTAQFLTEEKKIAREQAQFEAPTLKRQAEIDYERATRAADHARKSLEAKTKQSEAKVAIAQAELERQQNNLKIVQHVMEGFTVRAPASGMVIYLREYNGQKRGVGSQYYGWEAAVATLPNLGEMESQTYVNEVDIRRVSAGQHVTVSLDADPAKRLTGVVTSVANVGEQRAGKDSKVFEVKLDIVQRDTTLRPGMTTSNAIEVATIPDVLSVPIGAVSFEGGFAYVYKTSGRDVVKQMVEPGATNDLEMVVKRGLTANDRVLLSRPPNAATLKAEVIPGLKPADNIRSALPAR